MEPRPIPMFLPDPIWEATRPDRSRVTHKVFYDVERWGLGWNQIEQESVPCYSADEAVGVAERYRQRGKRGVRIDTLITVAQTVELGRNLVRWAVSLGRYDLLMRVESALKRLGLSINDARRGVA